LDIQPNNHLNLLNFRVVDLLLSADLSHIDKVLSLVAFSRVPLGPNCLVGIMTYEGSSIPVIDIAVRLELENIVPYTLETPIIVCSFKGRSVGLIATSIYGVAATTPDALQLGEIFEDGVPPCKGIIETPNGQSFLLDLDRMLDIDFSALEDRLNNSAAAGSPNKGQ
jgi:purine-binding chemotaxis protein CheW